MTSELQRIAQRAATGPFSARRTVHGFVLDTLRRAILEGELTGGMRLVQSEIADALDVSTTPVREALRDLAAEGLVELDPHRGGVVHKLNLDELDEIYRLRVILEPEAMRRAWPFLTDEVVAEAETLHHKMEASESPADWVALKTQFHGVVLNLAPLPRLLSILESLTAPWLMYVSAYLTVDPANRTRAAHGHTAILDALHKRDLDACITAAVSHLESTRNTLTEGYDEIR